MAAAPSDSPGSRARQAMLAGLAAALDGLVRKLGSQRQLAMNACALAPLAEEIAARARLLAFGRGRPGGDGMTDLVADLGALAVEAAEIAGAAERGVSLGAATAAAISRHAAELAALGRDPAALADPGLLPRALAPLVGTLQAVAVQRRDQGEVGVALSRLAQRSREFADRAATIAERPGGQVREEALRLSRDLGEFASDAVTVATEFGKGAASGERVATAMAGQLSDLSGNAAGEDPVARRIASMVGAAAPEVPAQGTMTTARTWAAGNRPG